MVRSGVSIAAGLVLLALAGGLLQEMLPPLADLIAPAVYGAPRTGGVPRLLADFGIERAARAAE